MAEYCDCGILFFDEDLGIWLKDELHLVPATSIREARRARFNSNSSAGKSCPHYLNTAQTRVLMNIPCLMNVGHKIPPGETPPLAYPHTSEEKAPISDSEVIESHALLTNHFLSPIVPNVKKEKEPASLRQAPLYLNKLLRMQQFHSQALQQKILSSGYAEPKSLRYKDFELSVETYPVKQTDVANVKTIVFEDLHRKGYTLLDAFKYGADWAVYRGKITESHSVALIFVRSAATTILPLQLIEWNRLAANVHKTAILAIVDTSANAIKYVIVTRPP